jgi:hypothetical protein
VVRGASSPLTVAIAGSTKYFRLVFVGDEVTSRGTGAALLAVPYNQHQLVYPLS